MLRYSEASGPFARAGECFEYLSMTAFGDSESYRCSDAKDAPSVSPASELAIRIVSVSSTSPRRPGLRT